MLSKTLTKQTKTSLCVVVGKHYGVMGGSAPITHQVLQGLTLQPTSTASAGAAFWFQMKTRAFKVIFGQRGSKVAVNSPELMVSVVQENGDIPTGPLSIVAQEDPGRTEGWG